MNKFGAARKNRPSHQILMLSICLITMAAILELIWPVGAIRNSINIPFSVKSLDDGERYFMGGLLATGNESSTDSTFSSSSDFPLQYHVTFDNNKNDNDNGEIRSRGLDSNNIELDPDGCESDEDCINPLTICERKSADQPSRCYGIRLSDCEQDSECRAGLVCNTNKYCTCPPGEVHIPEEDTCAQKVWINNACNHTEQCTALDPFSYCTRANKMKKRRICRCQPYYHLTGDGTCQWNSYDSTAAIQVYKITMILASCSLSLIFIIFIVCIVRRTYSRVPHYMTGAGGGGETWMSRLRNQRSHRGSSAVLTGSGAGGGGRRGRRNNSSLSSVYDIESQGGGRRMSMTGVLPTHGLIGGIPPPFDKPPTYDDAMRSIIQEVGVPPPHYVPPQPVRAAPQPPSYEEQENNLTANVSTNLSHATSTGAGVEEFAASHTELNDQQSRQLTATCTVLQPNNSASLQINSTEAGRSRTNEENDTNTNTNAGTCSAGPSRTHQ